jgi:hypothetical protein
MRNKIQIAVIILIACAFIGNFIRYSQRAPKRHYSDFRVYHDAGERFLKKENIYTRPDESITPFKYSPTFAFLMSPLSLVSRYSASLIFFTFNFLLLIVACVLSRKIIGVKGLSGWKAFALYFFPILFTSRFILHVWDSGQVNLLMFVLVLAAIYFSSRKKNVPAAAALSLSVLIKYMPAVFVPYFFVRKQYRFVAFTLIAAFFWLLLPAVYVGVEPAIELLRDWIPYISETSLDKNSWYDYKNQSFYSLVLRLVTRGSEYGISMADLSFNQGMLVAIGIGFFMYLAVLFPLKLNPANEALDYGLLFLCMALFNPNSWLMNYVVYLFVYMLLVYYLVKTKPVDKITLIGMISSFLLSSWASESLVGDRWQNLFEELSTVTIGALILMAVLLRLKFSGRWEKLK